MLYNLKKYIEALSNQKEIIHNEFINFVKDKFKSGGEYKEYTGLIKKINKENLYVILDNNLKLKISNIIDIELSEISLDEY